MRITIVRKVILPKTPVMAAFTTAVPKKEPEAKIFSQTGTEKFFKNLQNSSFCRQKLSFSEHFQLTNDNFTNNFGPAALFFA
jgi:hypothetical protein